jgi:hypothetical protein
VSRLTPDTDNRSINWSRGRPDAELAATALSCCRVLFVAVGRGHGGQQRPALWLQRVDLRRLAGCLARVQPLLKRVGPS